MAIEDQILGESHSIKVSLRTFVNQNVPESGGFWLESPEGFTRASFHDLGEKASSFLRKLKMGDKVLLVEYEGKAKALYKISNEADFYLRS